MSSLDDVLSGADPDDVRDIQQYILGKGGHLSDPVWIPYAAARRVQLETERMLPGLVQRISNEAAKEAAKKFNDAITAAAPDALKSLAQKAAETPLVEATKRATYLAMTGFVVVAWIVGLLSFRIFFPTDLPSSVQNYLDRGNKLEWLDCKSDLKDHLSKATNKTLGRDICKGTWWMTPGNVAEAAVGPLGEIAERHLVPMWLQWILWGAVLVACIGVTLFAIKQAFVTFFGDGGVIVALAWIFGVLAAGYATRFVWQLAAPFL